MEHISFGQCQTLIPTAIPSIAPEATPSGPTPIPSVCNPGWTSWMSASTPTPANSGDVETFTGLRMLYSFCQESAMESIECRVVGEPTASQYSGKTGSCGPTNCTTRHSLVAVVTAVVIVVAVLCGARLLLLSEVSHTVS